MSIVAWRLKVKGNEQQAERNVYKESFNTALVIIPEQWQYGT